MSYRVVVVVVVVVVLVLLLLLAVVVMLVGTLVTIVALVFMVVAVFHVSPASCYLFLFVCFRHLSVCKLNDCDIYCFTEGIMTRSTWGSLSRGGQQLVSE